MGPGTDYIGRLTLRMIMCFCQEARAKMRKDLAFQEVSGSDPLPLCGINSSRAKVAYSGETTLSQAAC